MIEQRWPPMSRSVMPLNPSVWETRLLIFAGSVAFDDSALSMSDVKRLVNDQYSPCRTKNWGLVFGMLSE